MGYVSSVGASVPRPTEIARQRDLSTEVLPTAIYRDDHTLALVGLLANNLVWGESKVFRRLFGLGTNEWRIISALSKYPGSTASELCEIFKVNKSIASKSITVLLDRNLVAGLDGPRRSRYLYLTQAGVEMHDKIAVEALRIQGVLHQDLTDDEIKLANSLLIRMLDASEAL